MRCPRCSAPIPDAAIRAAVLSDAGRKAAAARVYERSSERCPCGKYPLSYLTRNRKGKHSDGTCATSPAAVSVAR